MISRAKLPADKADHIEWDSAMPGFGIRTRAGGSKTYVVQYKIGAQNRRMTLGAVSKLTRDQARKVAKQILGKVATGQDPQAEKAAARSAPRPGTFKETAEAFLNFQGSVDPKKGTTRLRPSSLYSTQLYLMKHCKRLHLHQFNAEAVKRRDIASVLSDIAKKSGAVSADRARAALSRMFVWAMKEGLIESNPTIATNVYAGKTERDRVLTSDEIVAIWNALPDPDPSDLGAKDNDYGTIVKLLFLTAARPDEIADLRWSEVSLDERHIDLPAARSKNKRPFILPLSDSAFWRLLGVGQNINRRDLVFGRGRKKGFQAWSKLKAELNAKLKGMKFSYTPGGMLEDMRPWQLRDIRRTVDTGMNELGVEPHIVEACLNHVSGYKAGVAGVYNRAVYAGPKRKALEIWANHIAVILAQASGANVTTIHTHSNRA